jgi:dihydroxy-acid dehydratase
MMMLTGGAMEVGKNGDDSLDLQSVFEAIGLYSTGKVDEDYVRTIECAACPGQGSCSGLFTANTMACLTETLGLSLTGCATSLAVDQKKVELAKATGRRIVQLVREGVKARDIVSMASIRNAIRVDMSIGGSTNTALHIPAIARDFGHRITLDLFDEISRTVPHITSVRPGGPYSIRDLDNAGGIPAVLKRIRSELEDAPTVNGTSILEIADAAVVRDDEVLRPLDNPFHQQGGIAVLKGNLAPKGSVIKQAAVSEKMMKFTGVAKVFDSEADAIKSISSGDIVSGDVVVIRYEGPKGAPGMPEMFKPMKLLYGQGLNKCTALITDGRFSGTNNGCFVGHISPEAASGGPIALIENGDKIVIDVVERRIDLLVSEEELERRRAAWSYTPPPVDGYLARYARDAKSADQGGILK